MLRFGKAPDFPGLDQTELMRRISVHGPLAMARVLMPRVINQDREVFRQFLRLLASERMDFGQLGYLPHVLAAVKVENMDNLVELAKFGGKLSHHERYLPLKPGMYLAMLRGGHPVFVHPELPAVITSQSDLIQLARHSVDLFLPVAEICTYLQQQGVLEKHLFQAQEWLYHRLCIEGFIS